MPSDSTSDLIFDIGAFDGEDSAHYLSLGFRVVSVEANPDQAAKLRTRFRDAHTAGRWILVEKAITEHGASVTLQIAADDLAASSTRPGFLTDQRVAREVQVPGIKFDDLIGQFGVPHFLKVDIEGADALCIRALNERVRPPFVSFEVGPDVPALVEHLSQLGYSRFKLISQINFREAARQEMLLDRVGHKTRKLLGLPERRYVRRGGALFRSGGCSGPPPWRSDGEWRTGASLINALHGPKPAGWSDVHAAL